MSKYIFGGAKDDTVPMPDEFKDKPRTNRQNSALHKLFDMLAEALNDAGLDMRKTLKPGVEIPWTQANVKEYLWRPIQKAQLDKQSTTELTTKDIDKVYETLNRYLGDKHGLHVEFPSVEEIIRRQDMEKK